MGAGSGWGVLSAQRGLVNGSVNGWTKGQQVARHSSSPSYVQVEVALRDNPPAADLKETRFPGLQSQN